MCWRLNLYFVLGSDSNSQCLLYYIKPELSSRPPLKHWSRAGVTIVYDRDSTLHCTVDCVWNVSSRGINVTSIFRGIIKTGSLLQWLNALVENTLFWLSKTGWMPENGNYCLFLQIRKILQMRFRYTKSNKMREGKTNLCCLLATACLSTVVILMPFFSITSVIK